MRFDDLATAFASALVARDFTRAYAMTSAGYRAGTSLEEMERAFDAMTRPIVPLGEIHLMSIMEDWPGKQADDVGWAYVAIEGTAWGEAVTVVVASENGALSIREIEWGRP